MLNSAQIKFFITGGLETNVKNNDGSHVKP
jgi:hypothetical protein